MEDSAPANCEPNHAAPQDTADQVLRRRGQNAPTNALHADATSAARPLTGVSPLAPSEKAWLLALARETISRALISEETPGDLVSASPALNETRCCFVTLYKGGCLRGCVGNISSELPLYKAVVQSAANAARHDPRFPPVSPDELSQLRIEISVLSEPVEQHFESPEELLERMVPGIHGVLLRVNSRTATFLPQVWEHLQDKREFMKQLCLKAACPPSAWYEPDAKVALYESERFSEPE